MSSNISNTIFASESFQQQTLQCCRRTIEWIANIFMSYKGLLCLCSTMKKVSLTWPSDAFGDIYCSFLYWSPDCTGISHLPAQLLLMPSLVHSRHHKQFPYTFARCCCLCFPVASCYFDTCWLYCTYWSCSICFAWFCLLACFRQ